MSREDGGKGECSARVRGGWAPKPRADPGSPGGRGGHDCHARIVVGRSRNAGNRYLEEHLVEEGTLAAARQARDEAGRATARHFLDDEVQRSHKPPFILDEVAQFQRRRNRLDDLPSIDEVDRVAHNPAEQLDRLEERVVPR